MRDESSWEPKYKKAEFILLIFIRIAYCVCVSVFVCIKNIFFPQSTVFLSILFLGGDKEIMGNNDNNYAALVNIENVCGEYININIIIFADIIQIYSLIIIEIDIASRFIYFSYAYYVLSTVSVCVQ